MAQTKIDAEELVELKVQLALLQEKTLALTRENDELKEDKRELSSKVDKLMEALIAKEAPEAYSDIREDRREERLTPEDLAERERRQKEARLLSQYEQQIEQPLFRTAEEMMTSLSRASVEPPGAQSIHGNEES